MNQLLADRLARARARCPELRLGQLIVNAVSVSTGGDDEAFRRTLFYVTDEALVGMIEDFVFRVRPPSGTYRLDLPPLPSRP